MARRLSLVRISQQSDLHEAIAVDVLGPGPFNYLVGTTKLCDQLVCLISDEHSAKIVWKDEKVYAADEKDENREPVKAYERLFTFSVKQTNEERELANRRTRFLSKANHAALLSSADASNSSLIHLYLNPE